jgi:hypothetical protein
MSIDALGYRYMFKQKSMQHAASQEHDNITCLLSNIDSVSHSHRRWTWYEVGVQATNTSTTQPINRATAVVCVCTTNSNNSYNKNNSYYYCTKVKASLFSNVDVCMVKMYANTNTNIHIVIFQPKSSPQRSANGKRCPHHPSAIGKNIALNLNRFCVSLFMEIRDGECSFLHFTFSNSHRSDDREDRRWIEE